MTIYFLNTISGGDFSCTIKGNMGVWTWDHFDLQDNELFYWTKPRLQQMTNFKSAGEATLGLSRPQRVTPAPA